MKAISNRPRHKHSFQILTFCWPCISVINQLDAQNFCFTISFISCLYMFRAHVLIIRRSKLYYTASGIITPIGGRLVHTCAWDGHIQVPFLFNFFQIRTHPTDTELVAQFTIFFHPSVTVSPLLYFNIAVIKKKLLQERLVSSFTQ